MDCITCASSKINSLQKLKMKLNDLVLESCVNYHVLNQMESKSMINIK